MRFQKRINVARARGDLVVQPRMGFDRPDRMREGLQAVRAADAAAVGTITLDSYTRVRDLASVEKALAEGRELNGFPIVTHGPSRTRAMLEGIQSEDFPIQVRHGSAMPEHIFAAVRDSGIDATEGGPVSYCLPYGRTPLSDAIESWRRCAELGAECGLHIETFGGCMLGQMCPPGLLVAISMLEALFFAQRGVRSVSLSYAQQTSFAQDAGAIRALRQLASGLLDGIDWHLVLYSFMGVFPRTVEGAQDLLRESVRIAREGGAERLIVKTVAEAHRIPTIKENVDALELATRTWRSLDGPSQRAVQAGDIDHQGLVFEEARSLIQAVLDLHPDVGEALRLAFQKGYLDIPFCLHRDNAGKTRAVVDADGTLQWNKIGGLPIRPARLVHDDRPLNPHGLLQMLSTNERRFDAPHLQAAPARRGLGMHPDFQTIAIIGGGPRGLSVAERIGIELGDFPVRAIRVLLIDDTEPGAGRIWRTDQGPEFLMNTVTGQVTLFSGPRDGGPIRPGHGPSLYEWQKDHPDPAYAQVGPNSYARRRVYGEYMRDVLEALTTQCPRPHVIETLRGRVIDAVPRDDRFVLEFEDRRTPIVVDAMVLATGHAASRPGAEESRWLEFSKAGRCRFQSGDSAADLGLERIPNRERVGIMGLGLGFHDILAILTTGRGGQFADEDGRLIYLPSGREPVIVAGSRSGLPIPARGVNQKTSGRRYVPAFFNPAAVAVARQRALSASGSHSLSFREHLYPLIIAEMEHVYYGTWTRRLYGQSRAEAFARDHATLRNPHAPMPEGLLRLYGLMEVRRLDPMALARPFGQTRYGDPREFRDALVAYLEDDLREALLGNVDSPLKAALDVLRDVRDTLRSAVEFDGLSVASFEGEFKREFAPVSALLAAGPPVSRVSQLLAIEAAGLLKFIGPGLEIRCDAEQDCFRMSSPLVAGSEEAVTVLIDSRVPFPSLPQSRNPLLQAMRRRGLVRPYVRLGSDGEVSEGGIDVLPESCHVVGRGGTANPRIFAIGLPCESPRWFTQVGSGTPGVKSRFLLDAMAVGRSVLGAIRNAAQAHGVPAELEEAVR